MAVLSLLLLLAAARVDLVDEVYTIPPADWRFHKIELNQTPVAVQCNFQVLSKGAEVRVALLSRGDLERFFAHEAHGFLAATQPGASGSFTYHLYKPGEYGVVVDNRELHTPVRVRLRVSLDFSAGRTPPGVGYLSPGRRLAVIVISLAVFFAILGWSARKLLRAIEH